MTARDRNYVTPRVHAQSRVVINIYCPGSRGGQAKHPNLNIERMSRCITSDRQEFRKKQSKHVNIHALMRSEHDDQTVIYLLVSSPCMKQQVSWKLSENTPNVVPNCLLVDAIARLQIQPATWLITFLFTKVF